MKVLIEVGLVGHQYIRRCMWLDHHNQMVPRESLLFVIPVFGAFFLGKEKELYLRKRIRASLTRIMLRHDDIALQNYAGLFSPRHGFMHCDPHEANLLVRPHPSSKNGIFGVSGKLLYFFRLAYLYEDIEPKVIHWDIKASNILIDHEFNSKVSYFGLAKLLKSGESHITTRVMGTFGSV
ncbi:hypothetical protein AgCh_016623 [Apium graveolens]